MYTKVKKASNSQSLKMREHIYTKTKKCKYNGIFQGLAFQGLAMLLNVNAPKKEPTTNRFLT